MLRPAAIICDCLLSLAPHAAPARAEDSRARPVRARASCGAQAGFGIRDLPTRSGGDGGKYAPGSRARDLRTASTCA